MKICFLSSAQSVHTVKWSTWFAERSHEVHVISFSWGEIPGVQVHHIDAGLNCRDGDGKKLKYLLQGGRVNRLLATIRPDVVNAHYATSYGTVAALAGQRNHVVSVWGSDVYTFPQKSPLHKLLLKFSLSRAGYLFSTSQAMAQEAGKYTSKPFSITPFGVDMMLFSPDKRTRKRDDDIFVVGTVKTLTAKYGIDYLLRAAALLRQQHPEISLRLRIAGKGDQEKAYRALATQLGLDGVIDWLGFISQDRAAVEWANMDVGVIYSTVDSESFGVSAVEAQACGIPVIISDVPGLMEATSPGNTSLVVERRQEQKLAQALYSLYQDKELRMRMGQEGRAFVQAHYEINHCFQAVERIFEQIASENKT